MRSRYLALSMLVLSLVLPESLALAQRGGRGGGGGGRGGGGFGGGGGGMQRGGGGFGGGLSAGRPQGGMQRGGPSTGPFAGGGAGGPGRGTGGAGRPGMGAGGAGGSGSGTGGRPGVGAGGAGRPGVGAGGVGGPNSGIGARPGTGAGRPGVGAGGVGGPSSGIGALPGAGAGRPGTPGGYGNSYYVHHDDLAVQGAAVRAAPVGYPAYNRAMYAAYPAAWVPTNMANTSLYANPGYAAVAGQLGMAPQPVPQDYGGNVVVQPTAVYINGDNVGTPQDYAAQARQIAVSGNAQPDPNAKWQPLGVFAVAEPGQTDPAGVMQLAVNGRGQMRGNYHDIASDSVSPIAGAVDPKSQRAAWTIGEASSSPTYEAGIPNLTRDQTTMLAHSPGGQPQQLHLIRLRESAQAAGEGSPR